MKRFIQLLGLLVLAVILLQATIALVRAAVTLMYFRAIADNVNNVIRVEWETATELDFAGFYIQRASSLDPNYVYIQDEYGDDLLFYPMGSGVSGATYVYTDTDVLVTVVYHYILVMVDNKTGELDYTDPVTAYLGSTHTPTATQGIPTYTPTRTPTETHTSLPPTQTSTVTSTSGASQTPTPTPSPTQTVTPTPTSTGPTPTRTATQTPSRTPTFTPTILYATATPITRPSNTIMPTDTVTPSLPPTITPTPTTTLAPLASITLLFPVSTATKTATILPLSSPTRILPSPTPTPVPGRSTLRSNFLTVLIVLLWVALAGFLLVYLRRAER
jgi:hypothetical protein